LGRCAALFVLGNRRLNPVSGAFLSQRFNSVSGAFLNQRFNSVSGAFLNQRFNSVSGAFLSQRFNSVLRRLCGIFAVSVAPPKPLSLSRTSTAFPPYIRDGNPLKSIRRDQ
jgi:hypothetical protein